MHETVRKISYDILKCFPSFTSPLLPWANSGTNSIQCWPLKIAIFCCFPMTNTLWSHRWSLSETICWKFLKTFQRLYGYRESVKKISFYVITLNIQLAFEQPDLNCVGPLTCRCFFNKYIEKIFGDFRTKQSYWLH